MDGLSFVTLVEAELKRRKIPKEKFYKDSGVSSATMSQWRKNIYSPSSAKIKDIEEYLGISFEIGQKNKPTTDNSDELSDVKREAWNVIQDMDDDQLRAFIAAAQAFLK